MSSKDTEQLFLLVVFFGVVVLVFFSFILAIPLAVVGFAGYMMYYWRHNSMTAKERKAKKHTHALYQQARAVVGTADFPSAAVFVADIVSSLPETDYHLALEFGEAAMELYDQEGFAEDTVPPPPPICNSIEGARYRDRLSRHAAKLHDLSSAETACSVITESFANFVDLMPPLPTSSDVNVANAFTVSLTHYMKDVGECILALMLPFYHDEAKGLFIELREQLDRNLHEVSGVPYSRHVQDTSKLILPPAYKGENIAYAYLKNTPLLAILDARLPFVIPHNTRFEGHWIVAPPGSGKTTVLQGMLDRDFELVARDEASVIVMDSNRDLIKSIERLKRFAPGGDLEGKLVLIDAEDVEWPLALSLFGSATEHLDTFSARDREALYNSAVSMLDYIFGALLGAQMTSRQQTLFNFSIQLLFEIPDATLDTLVVLMQPGGLEEYQGCVAKLNSDARQFFELKFNSKEFKETKSQVVDRLFAIKRIQAISRMFSVPKSKLDFFTEMGSAKVILINIPRSLLQEDGVEVLGRFFLAMILLAAEKRQLLPKEQRLDTFLYIDECQDVIKNDVKIPTILDQCRKLRVGAILAHQRISQMSPPVLNALSGSTAIKFVANVVGSEASTMARAMNTTPDFITNQPQYAFAAHILGTANAPLSLSVPFVDFAAMEHMSDEEHETLRDEMRSRYATHQSELGEDEEQDDPDPPEPDDPDPADWG